MAGRRRTKQGDDPQVVRALVLLMELARSRRGVLLKAFADKKRYPLRAVYRDRDTLIKAGIPIRQNPDSPTRWQLMEGWVPPSLVGPAREEVMALFVACHLAPGLRGTTVGRSLHGLWAKLASPTPQQPLPLSEPALPFSIRALPAIDYGQHRVTLEHLREAIDRRHAVRIRYQKADGVLTERTIEPGFLHWDGGLEAMYVPSWCRLREAIRVFAVHRIVELAPRPTDPSRVMPAKRTMERAFRVWYRDRVEHVEVLFTARVAGEIRERQWHTSQRLIEAPDGGVYLHLDVSAPEELERWLLGFGPDARVVDPATLADQIQRLHAQAAGVGQVIEASEPRRSRSRTGELVPPAERVRQVP
jgi:predicted DNA-binding transcriptional regulator YafY